MSQSFFTQAITIRPGKAEDLAPLTGLFMAAYRGLERYGAENAAEAHRYLRWLRRTCKDGFLVAEASQGKPIGFIAACADWRDPALGIVLEIHEIAVAPAWQGKGVGRLLICRAYELGRAHGRTTAALWVGEGNSRARSWYAWLGFREIGRYGDWIRLCRPIPDPSSG